MSLCFKGMLGEVVLTSFSVPMFLSFFFMVVVIFGAVVLFIYTGPAVTHAAQVVCVHSR